MATKTQQRVASLQLQNKNGYENDLLAIASGDVEITKKWELPLTTEERTNRNNAIFDHWLAGETTTELAYKLHTTRPAIDKVVKYETRLRLDEQLLIEEPPVYNVWNYATCDQRFGQKHPGQIPGQAVINLLLWLTKPFDIVIDPMAGGGTTVDVCRYLLRRYHCFDIDPRREDIKKWDISEGYPRFPQKPNFILLDPPYWRLKRDEYSADGSAMSSYENWLKFMNKLARDSYKAIQKGGHIALFIQSFLDEWESKKYIMANFDCLNLFLENKFECVMDIALNMPTQVKSFRDVKWAKEKGKILSIKRDVYVFRRNK